MNDESEEQDEESMYEDLSKRLVEYMSKVYIESIRSVVLKMILI